MERLNVAWFSAGVTSAVACKLAVDTMKNVELYYIHINSHHEDNWRFIRECEQWIGKNITVIQSSKYKDQFDVINRERYVNGPSGARCTLELKKKLRISLEKDMNISHQVFGFEYSKNEINRAIRFKQQYPSANPLYPLIEAKIDKPTCMRILQEAGIELPKMYQLGYNNNNCIGCVKGKMGYWNKIREDFPDTFKKMAIAERNVNATCIKEDLKGGGSRPLYLDKLDPNRGRKVKPIIPNCGMFCQIEFAHIIDPNVQKIIDGQININDL